MNIQKTRIENLSDYIKAHGGAANVARSHTEIDPSYISQILTGKRGFGEKAARKMEERLKLPYNYFDTQKIKQEHENYSALPIEQVLKSVPILTWIQAVDYKAAFANLEKNDFIATDATVRDNTFALKINDDIMRPVFEPGSIAIIEPSLSPVPNDYVLAKDGTEATLKKLIKDGPDWYLQPLNPQYPTKDASKFDIVGVVIQVQSTTRFK